MTKTPSQRKRDCFRCRGKGIVGGTSIEYGKDDLQTQDGERVWLQGESMRDYLKAHPTVILHEGSERIVKKHYELCPECKGERKKPEPKEVSEVKQKVIIIDNNPLSIASYMEEHPGVLDNI